MKHLAVFLFFYLISMPFNIALCARAPVSEATEECLGCHSSLHPGIVEAWQKSRHAMTAPGEALKAKGIARRISAPSVPENLKNFAVGCAECHTLRPRAHADTFEHNEADVHVVVSPADCAVCHREEARQYSGNIMAHARNNLADNEVYNALEESITGLPERKDGQLVYRMPDEEIRSETCFYCHGTQLEVKGMETRDTVLGEMEFPRISGWPNQGVGRINLDGSRGSCSACHSRHRFSIETARKPYTCKECHTGPDVPSFKVYMASKHGTLYSSHNKEWNFNAAPWTVGKDFTAPTCASCHISRLVNTDGEMVVKRTHRMSERLPWRIFGLIYAHPHPRSPDTTVIRNKNGLSLPTDLDGTLADSYLISKEEQARRTRTMQAVCTACHSTAWTQEHWQRFEKTIDKTNRQIQTGTEIMAEIWSKGFAKGLARKGNPFDEVIERKWCDTWLFYGNTVRFASAMSGGGDYEVFADGYYQLTRSIQELQEWLVLRTRLFPPAEPIAWLSSLPEKKREDLKK